MGCGASADNWKKLATGRLSTVAQSKAEQMFAGKVGDAVKADVMMFSGCQDSQTSADVYDVGNFGLPPVDETEVAGGACTNAMLASLKEYKNDKPSYSELLQAMRKMLKEKKYTQVPQLSSSKQINMKEEQFGIMNPNSNGRTRALLIGINYIGQKGELRGCINDVKMMRQYLVANGFQTGASNMRILTDDDKFSNAPPTAKNIFNQLKWLTEEAQPGDSLFFHFSGHGGQMKDAAADGKKSDEKDGMDETLIPVDYQVHGMIRDDTIYKLLVASLPPGVQLTCVFDCCHSGTILDLPYAFAANTDNCAALEEGKVDQLSTNPGFNIETAIGLLQNATNGTEFEEVAGTLSGVASSLRRKSSGTGGKPLNENPEGQNDADQEAAAA